MKILLINGSPRSKGNTNYLLETMANKFEKEGMDCSIIQLAHKQIIECQGCMKCWETRNMQCFYESDEIHSIIRELYEADGIVLGSPVYHGGMTGIMKLFIDRVSMVVAANRGMLKRKVGAAISVARRAGGITVFNELNSFFSCSQMITIGSNYWNVGYALEQELIVEDQEALATIDVLSDNLIWLLKKISKN